MLKRFTVMLLSVIAASIWIIPTQAAGSPWTAWLYEHEIGRVTQVNDSSRLPLEL